MSNETKREAFKRQNKEWFALAAEMHGENSDVTPRAVTAKHAQLLASRDEAKVHEGEVLAEQICDDARPKKPKGAPREP